MCSPAPMTSSLPLGQKVVAFLIGQIAVYSVRPDPSGLPGA
jgi:hypothetical protein